MEVPNLVCRIRVVIAASIPATIVVNGITDVPAFDRMLCIAAIVLLPCSSRSPDDTCKAVAADLVNDRLEEIMKSLRVILIIGILQTYRLIGELYTDLSGMILHKLLLREDIPDIQQILVIVVTNFQRSWTYARRTNHHVHTMIQGFLYQFQIYCRQPFRIACFAEMRDIGLTAYFLPIRVYGYILTILRNLRESCSSDIIIICPCRVHVKTEHSTF